MHDDVVTCSDSSIGERGPMRFLMVAWLITVAALFGSVWSAYDSYRQYATTAQHIFRVQELRGLIVHLDEILTMSARMAVATGDLKWEQRYRSFEGKLDAAIQDAIALVPDAGGGTKQTDAANVALIEMENSAFGLVRQGQLEASREILFGDEYARQKAIYAGGMQILGGELASSADAALRLQRQRMLVQLFSIAVVILILVVGWLIVFRVLRHWRDELALSHRHLVDLNRDLDRKVMERTASLQRATQEAKQANKAKSEFLANMSHELRTPMNAILGYSEMLIEEAEDVGQDDFIPDLQKVKQAGNHLLSLINDVLDLAKIESGRMEAFGEDLDVGSLIDQVVSTTQPLMGNNNQFTIERGEQLGTAHQDITKLRQSLLNMLSNAAKFTHGGTITLRAAREKADGVDWLTFSVSDTGIGIPADKLDHVFEAFSQADSSTTRDYGGTGLGLPISRRFCQMLGGDLTVRSKLGEGSVFTMRVPVLLPGVDSEPLVEVSPVTTDTGLQALHAAGAGRTLLVIDDDPEARDIVERFLRKDGFKVVTAGSGEEGLRLAHKLKPAAITLDVMMPDMDGWSVLRALQADPVLRDIPVIMLTIVDDKSKGYALGATGYLTKPVDRNLLHDALARYYTPDESCSVLLVDDDKATREMMARTLEKSAWRVAEAGNGREALESLAQEKPQLILLDLMMPVMDGFDFLLEMRANSEWEDIPVIVLTAKDLTREDRRILNGRVMQIVEKGGCAHEQVVSLIHQALEQTLGDPGQPIPGGGRE
jgi:signal transduction histidine kinase/DNA-binding response OmpR family regulator